MKAVAIKLGVALAGMPFTVLLLRWTHHDAFFMLFLGSALMSILFWLDLARLLRAETGRNRWFTLVSVLFGVPQAILGLATLASGLGIICWVLYNTVVARQPEYDASLFGFGIGPLLTLVGAAWLVSAFRRNGGHEA